MESNPQNSTETIPNLETVAEEAASTDAASSAQPQEYSIAQATVVRLADSAAVVSFGWTAEGKVPFAEFETVEGKPAVKVGDSFEVLVEALGEKPEQIVLSKEKAEKLRAWDAVAGCGKGGQLSGTVVARIPGGYAVDVGMRAFLPSSQADIQRVGNPDALLGQRFDFTLTEFDKRRGNVVLSRRAILEKEQAARKQATLEKLTEGAVLPGVVRSIEDYGAFVDLGGLDGLLHITEMSWGRIGHPRELLKVGQELTVKVLKVDASNGRVSLGLKQLQEDPWASAAEKYSRGSKVSGKVVGFAEYGAFVELEPGIDGLVHVSEIAWKRVKRPSDVLKRGQTVEAVVLEVDPKARRIGLGMRQLQPNPWESLQEKYPVGTKITRKVRGVTDFGIFVEVEDGIDGLVHVSEMSWTGVVKNPGEHYKVGDEVEAVVLQIDVEHERLGLSIKQLTPDPWLTALEAHPVGSRFKGKVTRIADFGAFVEIEPGIEGLVHISQLSEERVESVASVVKVGDEIEVRVIDVNKRDRKVSLSVKALSEADEEYSLPADQGDARTSFGEVFGDKLRALKE
ncbi:MAG: 30S ribosomal protein S1 [Myxococcales bacterium]|jgi:small subunit ribosomal protein S1